MKQMMVTVTGQDRPGIIAAVTGLVFKQDCNLEDVSMTILEGKFAMMMIVALRSEHKRTSLIKGFQTLEKTRGLSVHCQGLRGKLKRGDKHLKNSETYLISAIGRDQTGIVYAATNLLARYKLNITDLNSKILGKGKSSVYAMLLEVDIPRAFKLTKLQRALGSLARKFSIEVQLRPVERISP